MASSLGELFIELGVFADTKELEQFENKLKKVNDTMKKTSKEGAKANKNFKDFTKNVRNVALAISGAIYALNRMTNTLVQNNQEFLNLIRNSDIALGSFQKWNNVGRMFGVKNAAQQLASLNQRLYELKLTGQGAEGFMLAGINPMGQDAEGIMEQLRNRVAKLDDTSATFLLTKMGLDPSMLHLLRMTRQEFEAFNQTTAQYRLTEEQAKQIQALNAQLEIARIKLQYLKDRAILAIMPYFVKFMQHVVNVVEGLRGLVKITTQYVQVMSPLQKGILSIAVALGVLKAALVALSAHPIVAGISAILGALFLLLDDIGAYFKGGRSGIGYLLYFFEELGQKLNSIKMPDWLGNLAGIMQNISKFMWKANPLTWAMPDYDTVSSLMLGSGAGTTNNDNRQVVMNNTINTPQTAQAVSNDLAYVQNFVFT